MLRRQPVFQALEPDLVASGIYKDAQALQTPLWTDANRVEFANGKVRHRKAVRRLLHPVEGLCRGIGQQLLSNGERVLWFVVNNSVYRWDVFSINEVATVPPSGLNSPYIDFTFYGDWAFINRGVSNVQFWNGITLGTMPEMPSNVRQLQKFLSFLLAIGVGSKRTGVAWSDASDVSKWNPTATNSAGAIYFDDFNSGIQASAPLGPVMAVYGDSQMGALSFIGAPFYFGKKTLLTGIGAVGPEAVTSVGVLNYGVGRQGPWRTDGQEFQYIDAGKMHDYFQENVNWDSASKIIVVRNDVLRTIEFYFPTGGNTEISEGWSFDPTNQGWSPIPSVSFFSEDMLFGLPVRANAEGELGLVGGRDYNSENLLLRTKPMLLQAASGGDIHYTSKVDEVELLLKDAHNVRMRVGSSIESAAEPTWSSYIPLDPLFSTYLVPAGVPDGTYWTLEFSSVIEPEDVTEAGAPVTVEGEQVTALSAAGSWRFNLQGFLLFGAIEGAK